MFLNNHSTCTTTKRYSVFFINNRLVGKKHIIHTVSRFHHNAFTIEICKNSWLICFHTWV
ncbi:MAG: hypothetical protein HRT89_11215 [Lentisphaeria bacterium]|nr:hypothetical protein [Lentisphaeria bacterium]